MRYPKRPRLKGFPYQGSFNYFVTIGAYQKTPYFQNEQLIAMVLPILQKVSTQFKFSIADYCFMPDHLHLLLVGEETSSLKDFVRVFKQRSSFYFRQKQNAPLWQPSYYDHILRKEESLKGVARYILENPVRKGLVDNFKKYAFLGSMIFDITEL